MKKLFPLFVCLILFSCAEKKKVKSDWISQNLKGQVKSIIDSVYKAVERNGIVQKDSLPSVGISVFNNEGFLLVDSSITKNRIGFRLIQKYDARNNKLERTLYKRGKISFQRICKYDEKNNVIDEIEIEPAQGNPVANDSLVKTESNYSYKYDEKGNILETIGTRDGKPWFKFINKLDNKGNVIEQRKYYAWKTTLNDFAIYKYDAIGNNIEQNWFNGDSILILKFTHKYDDKGNETEDAAHKRGDTLDWDKVMTYDDRGNLTRNIDYNKDNMVRYDYRNEYKKFDATGNWTEDVSYKMGKLQTITERTIKYY